MNKFDNAQDVLNYGYQAANGDRIIEPNPEYLRTNEILLASTNDSPRVAKLKAMKLAAGSIARVIDYINPDLSPYVRQMGEDFVWGVLAHRIFGVQTENIHNLSSSTIQGTYHVVGDVGIKKLLTERMGMVIKTNPVGFLDLVRYSTLTNEIHIAELKPDDDPAQIILGADQLLRYEAQFVLAGVTHVQRGTPAIFNLKEPITFSPFTYTYSTTVPGLFLWNISPVWEKFIVDFFTKLSKDLNDTLMRLMEVAALVVFILGIGKLMGATIETIKGGPGFEPVLVPIT